MLLLLRAMGSTNKKTNTDVYINVVWRVLLVLVVVWRVLLVLANIIDEQNKYI